MISPAGLPSSSCLGPGLLPYPAMTCPTLLPAMRATSRHPVVTLLLPGPSRDNPWSWAPWLVLPHPPPWDGAASLSPLGWYCLALPQGMVLPRPPPTRDGQLPGYDMIWTLQVFKSSKLVGKVQTVYTHIYIFFIWYIIIYIYIMWNSNYFTGKWNIFISLWMDGCIVLELERMH